MTLRFDEICIDAHDATALGAWWAGLLGWPQDIDDDGDVRLSEVVRDRPDELLPHWPCSSPSSGPLSRMRWGNRWFSGRVSQAA